MLSRCISVLLVLTALMAVSVASASAATRYVSTTGTGTDCTAAVPCASFFTAYQAAAPGDTVEVAAGSYGQQTIPPRAIAAPAVTFQPALGANVVLAGLQVNADNVTVKNMDAGDGANVGTSDSTDPKENVTFVDLVADINYLNGARDFLWKGGAIGPKHDKQVVFIGGQPTSHRVTYDGVRVHDATRSNTNVHTECMFAMGVQGLTVKNSHFENCSTFDLYVGKIGSDPNPRDIVLENTVFEPTHDVALNSSAFYSIIFDKAQTTNVLLRNNTILQAITWNPTAGSTTTNALMVGNIYAGSWNCGDGPTYRYTVMNNAANGGPNTACGTNGKLVNGITTMMVNPAANDFHLKAGAAAIDAADPADFPATDAEGKSRVGAPDAGAFEFGGTVQDTTPPSVPQGYTLDPGQTTVDLDWNASADNVGVAGYRVYVDDQLRATTTATDHQVTDLTCATTYSVAITAFDAAGNESNRAEATGSATTTVCPTPTPDPEYAPECKPDCDSIIAGLKDDKVTLNATIDALQAKIAAAIDALD